MLHCKICLVDPICKIGCDKLKDLSIKDLTDKIITRLINSNKEIALTKRDIKVVISDGVCQWYKNGELHRDGGSAVEYSDGTKKWYKNGELHRDGGSAVEFSDRSKAWYKNGELHREDGPAIEYSGGTKEWYKNGKRYRDNGPAIENSDEYSDGSKERINNTKP